jgi:hypothetical protein
MIPGLKPGTSRDEQEKMWKENEGKPWAMVQYHKSARVDMAKPMTRGFLIDLVIVVLLIFIFGKMSAANFMDILFSTLAIGFASWLWFPYTGHNWFETPMSVIQPDLIDIVVGWLLLGAWLGFWLRRK